MTFFKITNKPFHFLFVFIFICTATKPIFASPTESSKPISTERDELVLGDKDSLYLEKRKEVWHLMECTGEGFCREVTIDDMNSTDNITNHLKDLQEPIKDYCLHEEREDILCELHDLSLELDQRKSDKNRLLTEIISSCVAWIGILVPTAAIGFESLVLRSGTKVGITGVAVAVTGFFALIQVGIVIVSNMIDKNRDFNLAKKDIESIRQKLRDALANEDDSFKSEQLIDNPMP